MSNPETYTGYAFKQKGGKLEKVTFDWKDPQDGEVVVKVLACGVCGSDEMVENVGMPIVQLPRVPGHEIVGEIVAVGPNEEKWKVGERVGGGWHGGHCFTCDYCRAGEFNICEKEEVNGNSMDGGYAEYSTLRSEALVPVPTDMDPAEAAPFLCAGVTVFNSLRNMSTKPGDIVAVQGIGGLGHLAIQFAKKMGFRTVALSSSPSKKELFEKLGIDEYIDGSKEDQGNALQKLGGAKVIMCTAMSAKAMEGLIDGLGLDGQLLVLSFPKDSVPLYAPALISKRLSIRGFPSGKPKDIEETFEFMNTNGVRCLVENFPLEKAQEAYEHRAKARFRAVIVP
ncbi:GroES-like protein [Panus rudis PR-1116 ss-1]|nr:GroES-like protein [Panus rudis PR-1116 ss-1]